MKKPDMVIPVLPKYKVSNDAEQHLARSWLCGIDFYSYSGACTILAIAAGELIYKHFYTGDSYDQLGRFCVLKTDLFVESKNVRLPVWIRYCHNERVDAEVGDKLTPGLPIGVYGNTGNSNGPHLHMDWWVELADAKKASSVGLEPTGKDADRSPWPGAKVLRNVNPTMFLTYLGLDVINSTGD